MSLAEPILDLLYPPKCPFCQKILEDPRAPVCPACQEGLPWLAGERGERAVECAENCFSPLAYRDSVPGAVKRLKFSRDRAYIRPFGLLAAQCLRDHLTVPADALTWAPLSGKRLRERGFDQAERIARAVGKESGLPVWHTLLKIRDTAPQSELKSGEDRRKNARGAYILRPGAEVRGAVLVLVDDVVTSGSTLGECARVLRRSGARAVYCLTFAQAGDGTKTS